jgi:hypothetical protein
MTMLDLGFSGAAVGVASAASGFVADPFVCPEGVAAFCPPCEAVPPVAGVEGDGFGGVFWLEVEGVGLGFVAEVPGLGGVVEGVALGLVAEVPGLGGVFWLEVAGVPALEGDAFGGVVWLEVAGATLGLVAEVPGLEGLACPSRAVTGAVAPGVVVAADPLAFVSAFAGKANAIAKNGTASRLRNCGKEAKKPICSTLVAQNPIARRPLR